MLLPLVADVWQELLVRGEGLIVLQVVEQSQGPIQGRPLPPCMDPLCIQDMIWSQQEPMGPGA